MALYLRKGPVLKNINLLLVETSESDAISIAEFLNESEQFSYDITHLSNLEETHQFLTKKRVDIILINLVLSDSHGMHTFDNLFHLYTDIPFIILTDFNDHVIGINAVKILAVKIRLSDYIGMTLQKLHHKPIGCVATVI